MSCSHPGGWGSSPWDSVRKQVDMPRNDPSKDGRLHFGPHGLSPSGVSHPTLWHSGALWLQGDPEAEKQRARDVNVWWQRAKRPPELHTVGAVGCGWASANPVV